MPQVFNVPLTYKYISTLLTCSRRRYIIDHVNSIFKYLMLWWNYDRDVKFRMEIAKSNDEASN